MSLLIAMGKSRRITKPVSCWVVICALFSLTIGQSGKPEASKPAWLDESLRRNIYPFEIKDGKLFGQGENFLADSMKEVQFVAYGEEHNRRAVHQFGSALFRFLHENFGFNYLALEEDPYWGKVLSQAARKGGSEEIVKLALRYPNAFHLLSEEEMQMIGDAGKLSKAKENSIWGLNQVFGAAHIYARLVEIAPNNTARQTAQRLLDESLEFEKERFQKNIHYLVQVAKVEDFESLRKSFQPLPKSEAAWLIDQIQLSHQIFSPYGTKPSPSPAVFYEAGKKRETNMKHLFADRYREAKASGETLPKVLAIFGQLHLYRGLSDRTEQYSFGNFLSETAIINRQNSFHIYCGVDSAYSRKGFFAELIRVASELSGDSSAGAIIDLRPLFDLARRDKNLDPQLRRLIMSFDAFLFLKDAEWGSIKRLETPNFRWYPD